MSDVKEKLESMLNIVVEKVEEEEEKLVVFVKQSNVGRAIGPSGSVVRTAELILGRAIEVRGLE